MKKLFFFLLFSVLTFVGGCMTQPNTFTSEQDIFLNKTVITSNENCSGGFCTKFKLSKGQSVLFIGYTGTDWLFVEKIVMKIDGTDDQLEFEGDFYREVLNSGGVKEILTVDIDKRTFDFIKKSLGKKVYVRMYGEHYYKDLNFPVIDNSEGQWFQFVEQYPKL